MSNVVINVKAVEIIKNTIESLHLVSGSFVGKKFKVLEWQLKFLMGVFSKYDKSNKRIITEALLTIAKKNGKTEFIAGVVLCFCIIPFLQQREGEIVIVAGTKEQASILFGVVKKFIEYDYTLVPLFNIIPSKKEIYHKQTNMKIKVMASDMDTAQGINPYLVVVDEIGNIEKVKAQKLIDGLLNAFGAQEQPLFLMLSTQSPDHSHPFSLKINYAEKVNSGELVDENFYGQIHTVPDEDDIHDEDNWIKANPSIIAIPSIKTQIQKALKTGKYNPASMARARAYLFNQRYSGEVAFIGRDTWMQCHAEFDVAELRGCKAWSSLDLAGGRFDLSSLQILVEGKDDDLYVVSYFWTASKGLFEKAERDGVPYISWEAEGIIQTTNGETTNWKEMTQALLDICEIYDMQTIWYDRWRISELYRELDEIGEHLPLVECGQGFKSFSPCIDALEEYLYERKIWHNNACLTWNISNTTIVIDPAGLRKMSKKHSIGRIDGSIALAMSCRAHQVMNISATSEVVFI